MLISMWHIRLFSLCYLMFSEAALSEVEECSLQFNKQADTRLFMRLDTTLNVGLFNSNLRLAECWQKCCILKACNVFVHRVQDNECRLYSCQDNDCTFQISPGYSTYIFNGRTGTKIAKLASKGSFLVPMNSKQTNFTSSVVFDLMLVEQTVRTSQFQRAAAVTFCIVNVICIFILLLVMCVFLYRWCTFSKRTSHEDTRKRGIYQIVEANFQLDSEAYKHKIFP
ncbi:hypothetical protein EG68_04221 [Paragonimus skrjabini miyazakii]|uniref:MANSC domain-containing protein n=1 Tax=Paragonimus skrjabini miyazakii TaxID=59628 RepID=A0A8S9Z4L3_9TREM|nr:hypothetical protein EG68_04221 [Paragonimus skrjabini miyazakii]